ncbi:GNAT family N-acetyltransferase [Halalkalibacterium halodurans]|nr:GNAT family N-acetyltransferase [Halalkalibacterium halodurans]
MMEITRLQVAEPPVAKGIHKLQLESYQREASLIEYPHLPPLRESFEEVANFHGVVYGVQRKDALLGVIFVEPAKEATVATIAKLFVAENEGRKGIGCSLVTFVKTRYNTLYVSTTERNEPAIRLYQSDFAKSFAS